MSRKILFGIDGSERTYQALSNVGALLEPTDIHFHLFYAAPQSAVFHPGELATLSGEAGQWQQSEKNQAQAILQHATDLLRGLGFTRSRVQQEQVLKSVNAAQDILAASERQQPSAVVLARQGRSAVKRFFLGSTTLMVCEYAEQLPVWVVGGKPLKSPHLLVALDESAHAGRIIAHVAEHFGKLSGARFTLLHAMPAKPPGYWDDGHILNEGERSERQRVVAQWRATYEEQTGGFLHKAKSQLAAAGVPEANIDLKRQTLIEGIARDILAETRHGDYSILAFGRRGSSAIREFTLGSRAAKILQSPMDCTLVLVN